MNILKWKLHSHSYAQWPEFDWNSNIFQSKRNKRWLPTILRINSDSLTFSDFVQLSWAIIKGDGEAQNLKWWRMLNATSVILSSLTVLT